MWGKPMRRGVFVVGITDYAQGELGDVVYVELPRVGAHFDRMEVFGVIEAVKAVSDLYCPIEGEVARGERLPRRRIPARGELRPLRRGVDAPAQDARTWKISTSSSA